MMPEKNRHWTERSFEDFQFRIASDFIVQLESRLDELGWSHARLARELKVTEGRVSQLMNNPGNLRLNQMVKCVRAVGLKVAVVAYDDGDMENLHGPVNSQLFRLCWEKCDKPVDFWALDHKTTVNNLVINVPNFCTYSMTMSTGLPGISLGPTYYADVVNCGMFEISKESTFQKHAA